jgi:serine/threonine-protein kinase
MKNQSRYQKAASPITALLLFVTLVSACSKTTTVDQTAEPTMTIEEATSTATAQPPTATLEPTPEPTPDATATLEAMAGMTRIWEVDQMVQIYIPAGEFTMGADDEDAKTTIEGGVAYPENPVHTVYLDSYWIDKYEVTNRQYALCVDAGVCVPPFVPYSQIHPWYYGNPEFDDYPVVWVNWDGARAYCEWAGRRLLTEAEWEKAARGTDARKYPWGNEPVSGELVNFCDANCPREHANHSVDDGYPETAPVGSFPAGASPYGVMDMAGNVWEWGSSLIMPYPYDATDGREDMDAPGKRIWRGGPWSNGWWWMRSSLRYYSVPFYLNNFLGIRCGSSE